MTVNTGFRKHIGLSVDKDGERPSEDSVKAAYKMLGDKAVEKWFDVSKLDYDKLWMWVLGIN